MYNLLKRRFKKSELSFYFDVHSMMEMQPLKYMDLFCGIGGFRFAMEKAAKKLGVKTECVFSSDIDNFCQDSYEANFGDRPKGDITKIEESTIPDADILFAGFPCQPFSIIGQMKGLSDTRGTLFFNIERIIKKKQPKIFILENVKQLAGHDKGRTLRLILKKLRALDYTVHHSVLNALDFGLPQKRERVIIVGFKDSVDFAFPAPLKKYLPLSKILEENIDEKHYASEYIREKRKQRHTSKYYPSIWHENKAGNICSYPYSCALRAGASYNYLLVNGERRLTSREMLRLQGFPDKFKIVVNDGQIRKQIGNAVPVNVIEAVITQVLSTLIKTEKQNKKRTLITSN